MSNLHTTCYAIYAGTGLYIHIAHTFHISFCVWIDFLFYCFRVLVGVLLLFFCTSKLFSLNRDWDFIMRMHPWHPISYSIAPSLSTSSPPPLHQLSSFVPMQYTSDSTHLILHIVSTNTCRNWTPFSAFHAMNKTTTNYMNPIECDEK